jgi:hypothetical protein
MAEVVRYTYRSLFDEFCSIIEMQKSHADRQALMAIKAIVESQTSERRRQGVFVHFEKKVCWRLKEAVADMHEYYNTYIREPHSFAPCSWPGMDEQYMRMVQQARDEEARASRPRSKPVMQLEHAGA